MTLTLADEKLWDKNWEKYSSEDYSDEFIDREQEEQGAIESAIARMLGDEMSLGFDWIVDHFNTPRFIFTITLQNSILFHKSIIEAIIKTVTEFNERWKLNLGLVDAIHDGVWDSTDDVATLLVTPDDRIIMQHPAYKDLNIELRQWLDQITIKNV